MARRLSRFITASLLAAACGLAHPAELGEVRVSSFIGQQLVADIELTTLEDAGNAVQVQLARADVYRGANIALPPVLASLTMSVMRRDGRQFLHITSLKPVEADHVHLFLELGDGAHRNVRLATLWLAPDPNPAPAPVAVAPAALAPAPEAKLAADPEAKRMPVQEAKLAHEAKLAPDAKPALARIEASRAVARIRRPAPVVAPPVEANVAAPAPKPAACVPQFTPQQIEACVALDAKNASLREQLGRLEGKVKVLQVSMAAAPATRASLEPMPTAPAKIKPKQKQAAPEPSLPWRWIGVAAGLLAAAAGVAVAIRARAGNPKKPRKNASPVVMTPSAMPNVKSRLMQDQAE